MTEKIREMAYQYERVTGADEDLKELQREIRKLKKKRGVVPVWMEERLKW